MFESLGSNNYTVYPDSVSQKWDKIYFLARKNLKKFLISDDEEFESQVEKISCYNIYERTHANALKLRKLFGYLNPRPCGLKKSFGFGDRLGLATPGHVKAIEKYDIFPVFAQQSIRELERTKRTMEQVIDDAMWGVFQTGFKNGWGADIDHVKNEEDILKAIDCGFTMFTIDSSDIKHIASLYNLIEQRISSPFDFEISIDETDQPTSFWNHILILEELRRAGVNFTGLALRFIGKFEKGIDYIGDKKVFEKDFLAHLGLCENWGGYKPSIHSGSDKFSIYPIIRQNAETFHVKTSGTSWLEALRLISCKNPNLFRSLYQLAFDNFEKNRQAYQINTTIADIPTLDDFRFKDIFELLDNNAARQLLHISYGTLLEKMRDKIYCTLNIWERDYYALIKNHLNKHLKALS